MIVLSSWVSPFGLNIYMLWLRSNVIYHTIFKRLPYVMLVQVLHWKLRMTHMYLPIWWGPRMNGGVAPQWIGKGLVQEIESKGCGFGSWCWMCERPPRLTCLHNNNKLFLLLNGYLIGLRTVAIVLSTKNTIQHFWLWVESFSKASPPLPPLGPNGRKLLLRRLMMCP